MSDGVRIPIEDARALAHEAIGLIRHSCGRIETAGSIRRRKEDVGDIEILCIPKLEPVQTDLFGGSEDVSEEFVLITELVAGGTFEHRLDKNGHRACGKRFQRLLFKGFPLDIFCVLPPSQWGVAMAIRTGPAELSKRLVTSRFVDPVNGCLPIGMQVKDNQLIDRGKVIETPEEEDFFRAIKASFRNPWERF